MALPNDNLNILNCVDAAIAVIPDQGELWCNSNARALTGRLTRGQLAAVLTHPDKAARFGLCISAARCDGMTVYTLSPLPDAEQPPASPGPSDAERVRQELLTNICLVCAYSEGTLDGIYYAVSETARMLGTDCTALFLFDDASDTWKSICLCTGDGDNAGYSVRTDIPAAEFAPLVKKLDEKSCLSLTGTSDARLVSGEDGSVCAARISAEKAARAILWLERRDPEQVWTKADIGFVYILLGVLKMALRRSRMERELKAALDKANEANRTRSEFLSSISHEIRTPINSVLGMISLARDSRDAHETGLFLEKAENSAVYLLGLINDILDITCIEAGRFALTPHNCSLHALIDSVCDMFSYPAQSKGLEFVCQTEPALPEYIYADDQRLRQVLVNLLSNALKFTEQGCISLTAGTADNPEGRMLSFTVSDTGSGIPPEAHERIFLAFERLDSSISRHIEGIGLGLRITRSLLEQMGGSITLDSTPGAGSTFTVTIPLHTASEDTPTAPPAPVFSAPGARVLIAEDNEVSAMVTCGMLRRFGIKPDLAVNGRIAADMAGGQKYDLILMDHMMPVMDGIEACRTIRAGGSSQHSPIVALTANVMASTSEALMESGMSGILSKPLFCDRLAEALLQWLPKELIDKGADEAAAAAGLQEDDLLCVSEALERMGGSHELYLEALTLTGDAIGDALREQSEMLSCGELAALRVNAHGLKGVLATIGAKEAAGEALQLERLAAQGDLAGAKEQFAPYRASLERLSDAIGRYIERYRTEESK